MDVEALALLESQTHFCQDLINNVLDHECFILLAGESGSGRTASCEYVVNETDSKMRAVFIPCNPDMQLQRLRELFLQQLLPNTEFETTINLADALSKVDLPRDQKILVVVDDVDSVIVSFYNELLALYEQFLGQERFAFILVGHSMWAEEKIRSYMGKAQLSLKQIPALNLKESLVLSRHIFALNNTMRVYNAIVDKLPTALASAKGNLSQIITITEKLMKDPTTALNTATDKGQAPAAQSQIKKKKSSSVGIFVSVVCIIIVLACLIPILLGGNFFSSSPSNTTATSGANNDALVFDENQYEIDNGVLPPKIPTGVDAPTPDSGTEHSVTLSGEELDKIEGGANNSGYPRRVDGSVNNQNPNAATALTEPVAQNATPQTTQNSMPQPALVQQPQQPSLPVLQRSSNMNHQAKPQVTPPDISAQVAAANQKAAEAERAQLEQKAKEKLEADRKLAEAAKQKEEQIQAQAKKELEAKKLAEKKAEEQAQAQAKAQAQAQRPSRPPLRAGQIINLADEQRQLEQQRQASAARQPQPYRPDNNGGNAVEGRASEISSIANNHFTVQIVSASNRANIKAAAQGLNGKFWILETSRNGRPWYVLCAGDYASRAEAAAAANRIPRSVSQGATPFVKAISDLKAEFRL